MCATRVWAEVGPEEVGVGGPWCRESTVREGGEDEVEEEEEREPMLRRGWRARKATKG
jgi:hypothetical protein